MIREGAIALVLLAAAAGRANAEPVTPGIYGNVELSEESGDLGGVELELIGTGTDARVEFVICEGWCNSIYRAPVTLTPNGFTFSYVENYVDQDGNPARSETNEITVERKGAGVTVTITRASTPDTFYGYVLKRIDKRFGLYVASDED